eukprot:CAMPEP_0168731120 /NCGR_PEP_ID=MMETSP0724-20121128/7086_1 /TAXON_ID=265536 /ORGANISM="Amphiprora sp., Strain CCMP467" /LENGTH=383 /DNA_ID=CAMNT_0008778087 /DNA_START=228 /DNA_END=1376 /DNA_ORIENTATION=-
MEGLDNQAEQELRSIRDKLYTQNVVEIKHSSRDNLMARICEILCSSINSGGISSSSSDQNAHEETHENVQAQPTIQATSLVFRSGLSLTSLVLLKVALGQPACRGIEELDFVNLWSMDQVRAALRMVRRQPPGSESDNDERLDNSAEPARDDNIDKQGATIRTLKFTAFRPRERMRGAGRALAELLVQEFFDYAKRGGCYDHVAEFHLHAYPFGSVGSQVLAPAVAQNTTLNVLRLQDCDLQSDSATSVAQMIRHNTTLQVLDLSDNPYYLSSDLTWEMTVKVLIRHGLQHNTTLLELPLMVSRRTGRKALPSRTKLDKHLKLNRFAHAYFVATALPKTRGSSTVAPRNGGNATGHTESTALATGNETKNHRCDSMELIPALW